MAKGATRYNKYEPQLLKLLKPQKLLKLFCHTTAIRAIFHSLYHNFLLLIYQYTLMNITPEISEKLKQLSEKYEAMGQDMLSYLEGLLYADTITYWDYIQLDVLLNLQKTETSFEDEVIFLTYHQITELYFKLILHAINIIADDLDLTPKIFVLQLKRINTYFDQLINSFDIMIDGMDKEQFLKFRMSLLPASGFQSAQFRMIEVCSTNIDNLIHVSSRPQLLKSEDISEKYEYLYWKRGATELATGKKTLTLKQFEQKYSKSFISLIRSFYHKNLWERYKQLDEEGRQNEVLIQELRRLDVRANILWPLAHFRSAARYLQKDTADIAATGGTNWQEYLPPKNQLITFFPELWTEEERQDWGKRSNFEAL